MRDLSADLREHLDAVTKEQAELTSQLRTLEARKLRLEAFLRDEEGADPHSHTPSVASKCVASGDRLRAFVLKSLADGHERDLDDLKKRAQKIGLTTAGASGRSLNIILVNLHRRGLVTRLGNGKWRRQDDRRQLALPLETRISADIEIDPEPQSYRRCA